MNEWEKNLLFPTELLSDEQKVNLLISVTCNWVLSHLSWFLPTMYLLISLPVLLQVLVPSQERGGTAPVAALVFAMESCSPST